jgi:hypothetical protein
MDGHVEGFVFVNGFQIPIWNCGRFRIIFVDWSTELGLCFMANEDGGIWGEVVPLGDQRVLYF